MSTCTARSRRWSAAIGSAPEYHVDTFVNKIVLKRQADDDDLVVAMSTLAGWAALDPPFRPTRLPGNTIIALPTTPSSYPNSASVIDAAAAAARKADEAAVARTKQVDENPRRRRRSGC